MDITTTGDGLSILLACDYCYLHDWMSFAAWYSKEKNLPDAKFAIVCTGNFFGDQFFSWTYRFGVKFFQYREDKSPLDIAKDNKLFPSQTEIKIITPYSVAVRPYNAQNFGPLKFDEDTQESGQPTFVSCEDHCGKFVTSEWIDKYKVPFQGATSRFYKDGISVDEYKVLRLWEKFSALYTAV